MAELASKASGGVELAVETLAPRSALALICLAAFPSRFDVQGAASVLGVADVGFVQSTLIKLRLRSLVRRRCCPRVREGGRGRRRRPLPLKPSPAA